MMKFGGHFEGLEAKDSAFNVWATGINFNSHPSHLGREIFEKEKQKNSQPDRKK